MDISFNKDQITNNSHVGFEGGLVKRCLVKELVS